ncbi:MAG: glycosyltransferase family 2 protein [Candidatus Altiarchaeota archaeon]|nr:glycosyltransferase family 2 protein [Candidatus Altiarchaeota archaeon]
MVDELKPKVSVVIPCFNDGRYLREAIDSVEKCKKDMYEIIIVNDGSTERLTKEVLKGLRDDGYNIIDTKNIGPCHARNIGISNSSGEYILPVDADNLIKPEYMVEGVKRLDANPLVGVVYGDCIHFDDKGKKTVSVGEFERDKMALGNYIDTCAVFRKKLWKECGGYDESLYAWEDWELWINAYCRGWLFEYIPQVMFYYRDKPNSLSEKCGDPKVLRTIKDTVMKKHLKFFVTNA